MLNLPPTAQDVSFFPSPLCVTAAAMGSVAFRGPAPFPGGLPFNDMARDSPVFPAAEAGRDRREAGLMSSSFVMGFLIAGFSNDSRFTGAPGLGSCGIEAALSAATFGGAGLGGAAFGSAALGGTALGGAAFGGKAAPHEGSEAAERDFLICFPAFTPDLVVTADGPILARFFGKPFTRMDQS